MAVEVDDLKAVLYLDGDEDNLLLGAYLEAAEQFTINAVGNEVAGFYERPEVVPLFDAAVKARAATLYQYRIELTDVPTYPVDLTFNSIIGQLRGMYLVAKEEIDNAPSDQPAQQDHRIGQDADDQHTDHSGVQS